jgi:hypothetical protein
MNLGKLNRYGVLMVVAGVASVSSAQSIVGWFNVQGSASTSQPSTIFVTPGSTVTLSVYIRTTGMANTIFNIGSMIGYDTATSTGLSATAAGSGITAANPVWASGFGTATNLTGGGSQASGSRPYGKFTSVFTTGTFTTSDNADIRLYDITLTVSNTLANGSIRPVTLHNGGSDSWSSFVFRDGQSSQENIGAYTANLQVVPEPATLAVLGLGALALRRRRKSA